MTEALLFVPALLISGFNFVWYERTLAQFGVFERGYTAHGLAHVWNLLMLDPMVFWIYVRQVFFPTHLSMFFQWPALLPSYPGWQIAASCATVVLASLAGLWFFLRRKDLLFFYASFFVLMLPYLNLRFMGIWVAERYVYFSCFCLLALAISALLPLLKYRTVIPRMAILAACAGFLGLNVFHTIRYQRVWHDPEALYEYHLALPNPSPIAFENLAAYYYSVASEHRHDPEAMSLPIGKMAIVVDAGLNTFWRDRTQAPPSCTSFLFFLRSIIQELTGEPEAALQSLLTSDRLKPNFDATNLNLARLYRKLSHSAQTAAKKREFAMAARERFRTYLQLAFRGRPAPPDLAAELAQMEAECGALNELGLTGSARVRE